MEKTSATDNSEVPSYLKLSKIITWILYFWITVGVVSLVLRVFLLLFSANLSAGFADFVMRLSSDYLQPFQGIFPGRNLGETGYLDISSIFAILVYLFAAWGIKSLIDYFQSKIDTATRS